MIAALAAIAVGGTLGALLRGTLVRMAGNQDGFGWWPRGPAAATLISNTLGCLLFGLWLGFGSSWAAEFADAVDLEVGVTIGFCGGLTTFSTLCSDAIRLANHLGSRAAGLYLAETIALGLSAFWLGAFGLPL